MKKITIIFIQLLLLVVFSVSCGDKPKSEAGISIKITTTNIPKEVMELVGDSAELSIYENGNTIVNVPLNNIIENKSYLSPNLVPGKHNIAVFLTGPNPDVVYMLDRKELTLMPDIENTVDIEIVQPIKFNIKTLNLSLNQEVKVTAKIDSSRLPNGITAPEIFWTIDNIPNGSEELGTIISEKDSATIKGPAALPSSSTNHYLGAYYEIEGKKFISVIKINYIQQ